MKTNSQEMPCIHCGENVPTGAGVVHRFRGAWLVRCRGCVQQIRDECVRSGETILSRIEKDVRGRGAARWQSLIYYKWECK
jgi:NAD-dependent SIR2 family protein deacetylase